MLVRSVLLSVSVMFIGIGVVVYHRAPDRVWNRIFAVHALAVSGWVFLNYLIQSASTVPDAELWLRLTHPVVAVAICSALDLVWVFPERIKAAPWTHRVALYATGLAVSAVALVPELLTSIEFAQDTVLVEYGSPFILFGMFTVTVTLWVDLVLLRKALRLTGLQRVQLVYMLVGLLVGQVGAILTMVLLPLVWHNTYFSRWGPASYVFIISGMAYAIAKHRIVRPKVALYRAAAYLLTGAGVAALFAVGIILAKMLLPIHNIPLVLAYIISGIVMGIAAVPIHIYIRHTIDRTFLPQSQLEDSSRHVSEAILRTLNPEELPEFLSDTIVDMFHPTRVGVFVRDGSDGQFICQSQHEPANDEKSVGYPDRLPPEHILVRAVSESRNLLHRAQVFRFRSLAQAQPLSAAMRQLGTAILAPMLWENELVGFVCVGDKQSGEMYEAEELAILRNIMPQTSLALRNAQLYAQMAQMKEYNENILREMESSVIAVDAQEKVVLYNPAAERMLGLSRAEVIGHSVAVLPEDIASCLRRALNSAQVRFGYQFTIRRPDEQTVPVSCSTSGWGGGAATQEGAVAVISDLTLVQELERERQEAKRLAVIRVLSAGMAHEIRNPMVAIRTFAELLPQRWEDPEFRSDFLATAQGEINRIDQLLGQLLVLSKPADAVTEDIQVNEICKGVVRAMSAQAESQQVELITDLAAISYQPIGDESRLHQALVNLVTNAIDAEPQGGLVKVITEAGMDDEEKPTVLIRVYNSGSHIPRDQIEQIFSPFYSQKPGGTGLGLAICQTIIEEHNGSIEVHSTPEQGTEFVVELPAGRQGSENGEA